MPDGAAGAAPDQIGRLLIELARRRPGIDIRLLIWRSALAISATQGFLPHRALGRTSAGTGGQVPARRHRHRWAPATTRRCWSSMTPWPFAAAEISAATAGTPLAHLPIATTRRLRHRRRHAPPRHEVMVMVDGPIPPGRWAIWRGNAAGTAQRRPTIPVDRASAGLQRATTWPDSVPADAGRTRACGIARTEPASADWRGGPEADEVERLTAEAIAQARDTIYLENQYFSSPLVTEALARRLADPNGPQIVLVSTQRSRPSYWFDQHDHGPRRARCSSWRLRAADVFQPLPRLRAVHGRGAGAIIVHAKVMIIDDRLARIGSANLNHRSTGFDTECDLAVEPTDAAGRAAIRPADATGLAGQLGGGAPAARRPWRRARYRRPDRRHRTISTSAAACSSHRTPRTAGPAWPSSWRPSISATLVGSARYGLLARSGRRRERLYAPGCAQLRRSAWGRCRGARSPPPAVSGPMRPAPRGRCGAWTRLDLRGRG